MLQLHRMVGIRKVKQQEGTREQASEEYTVHLKGRCFPEVFTRKSNRFSLWKIISSSRCISVHQTAWKKNCTHYVQYVHNTKGGAVEEVQSCSNVKIQPSLPHEVTWYTPEKEMHSNYTSDIDTNSGSLKRTWASCKVHTEDSRQKKTAQITGKVMGHKNVVQITQ